MPASGSLTPQAPEPQAPQPPAQGAPSVTRLQASDSTRSGPTPQVPSPQSRSLQVRLRVPFSPHSPAKPSHSPQSPQVALPQTAPSVSRTQPWVSGISEGSQIVATQEKEVTVRVWEPPSSQVPSKRSQALHALVMGSGQSSSLAQPTQALALGSQLVGAAQGSPEWIPQLPPAHWSVPLQKSPSSQAASLGTWTQPPVPHRSSVQGLSSSQPPGTQAPPPSSVGPASSAGPASDPASTTGPGPASGPPSPRGTHSRRTQIISAPQSAFVSHAAPPWAQPDRATANAVHTA